MSNSKSQHDAIPGFIPIAPSIWEYTPTIPVDPLSVKPSIDAPNVIILFSWTGAHGRHVSKYAMKYQTLFPTTRIMIITTSATDLCFRNSQQKQRRLWPAVDRLISYEDNSNILIHVFSEGGSQKATEFAEAYHTTTGSRLPCTALMLDSTPGHPRYIRLCNALTKSLPPNPAIYYPGLLLGRALVGARFLLYYLQGFEKNSIARTRRRLLDPTHWDPRTPRCYLYSKGDDLIAWQDVREHAMESLGRGIPVMDVAFDKSAHCKHATEDPDQYWGSVIITWQRAVVRAQMSEKWPLVSTEVVTVPQRPVLKQRWSDADSGVAV